MVGNNRIVVEVVVEPIKKMNIKKMKHLLTTYEFLREFFPWENVRSEITLL